MRGRDLDHVALSWNVKRWRWWIFYEPDFLFKPRLTKLVKGTIR